MGTPIKIRNRVKLESEWVSLNPVLRDGEVVYSHVSSEVNPSGELKRKLGNGTDHYNDLPFCEDIMISWGEQLPTVGREGQIFLLLKQEENG